MAAVVAALLVGCLVFVPGLDGPFFFDDFSNLLTNRYIQLHSLGADALYRAALSLTAGPLGRPLSMVSFALNYYAAGSFDSALPFKLVNLAIHFLNGMLVYWLGRLVLARAAAKTFKQRPALWAGALAFAWLVHPIQLSSVLYVVQRMTELAATFTLLGLICYVMGRNAIVAGEVRRGVLLLLTGLIVCWPPALYSKETALLLPVFALVIEYCLFASEKPWTRWRRLRPTTRGALLAGATLAAIGLATAAVMYSLPLYSVRTFTLIERLLTEARVLWFYIGLILIPRIDEYSLFHDDIAISASLISPWTTLPALLGLAGLAWLAIRVRGTRPLLTLGILWFFAGHLLESTVFPLEIAHEHRNYLPSFGILLVALHALGEARLHWKKSIAPAAVAAGLVAIAAGISALRADQWSSEETMASYEAAHHPLSPASQVRYANVLLREGKYDESQTLVRRAAELAPYELSYLISVQSVAASRGGKVNDDDSREIAHRLATGPITASTLVQLTAIGDCVTQQCAALQPHLAAWAEAMLANPRAKDASYGNFLLGRARVGQGRYDEAVAAYKQAYELDHNYAHPLLDLAQLYLYLGRVDYAEIMVEELRRVSARTLHTRDDEIERLAEEIRRQKSAPQKHGAAHPGR